MLFNEHEIYRYLKEIASACYILEICIDFSTYPSSIWAVILDKDTYYKICS